MEHGFTPSSTCDVAKKLLCFLLCLFGKSNVSVKQLYRTTPVVPRPATATVLKELWPTQTGFRSNFLFVFYVPSVAQPSAPPQCKKYATAKLVGLEPLALSCVDSLLTRPLLWFSEWNVTAIQNALRVPCWVYTHRNRRIYISCDNRITFTGDSKCIPVSASSEPSYIFRFFPTHFTWDKNKWKGSYICHACLPLKENEHDELRLQYLKSGAFFITS